MAKARRRPPRVYEQVEEGVWEDVLMKNFRSACCDCGLIHRVNYRRKDGVLQVQVYRDERATAQIRRGMRRRGTMIK